MKENQKNAVFKVILVGAQAVGKTAIITRFIKGSFQDQYFSTIGVDFKLHNLTVGQQNIKLQIWDTAGQQRYQSLASNHFKGAHGCICVIDITKKQSIESAKFYLNKAINQYNINNDAIFLVANKIDLEASRELNQDTIREIAEQYQIDFINVSAKDGTGINKVFEDLTRRMLQFRGDSETSSILQSRNPIIEITNNQNRCKC